MQSTYATATYLAEDHGRDLLWRKRLGLAQVVNLDHWAATLISDFERPALNILLHSLVIESTANKTPLQISASIYRRVSRNAYLTSKTVFSGFMAA